MPNTPTSRRKDEHLDLAATGDVAPSGNSALFDDVRLVHCAMPELAVKDVELSTTLFGKKLNAPLLVTGMTGGTERAAEVNRQLAAAAEAAGVAFGVGSQRAMAEHPELASTFKVRDVAPSAVLLGNIGVQQAARLGVDAVLKLRDAIGADAMALHLNPGQELAQPEGDRDFREGYATVTALVKALEGKLLVKETGCGLSPEVARRLVDCGVTHLDVSGLGGTSWIRVEQLRASGVLEEVGAQFAGWGVPTAAAVALVRKAVGPGVTVVASGGVRTGLDVAKALALGADVGGAALPLFRAQQSGGEAGVRRALSVLMEGLRTALVLTGSRTPAELRTKPRVVTRELKDWLGSL